MELSGNFTLSGEWSPSIYSTFRLRRSGLLQVCWKLLPCRSVQNLFISGHKQEQALRKYRLPATAAEVEIENNNNIIK